MYVDTDAIFQLKTQSIFLLLFSYGLFYFFQLGFSSARVFLCHRGIKIGSYPKPELSLWWICQPSFQYTFKNINIFWRLHKSAKVQLKKAGCFSISSPLSLILFLINLKTSE